MLIDPTKVPVGVVPPTLIEQGRIDTPRGTQYAVEVWKAGNGEVFAFVSNNYGGESIVNNGVAVREDILNRWPGSTIITHWIEGKSPGSKMNSNGHCFGQLDARGNDTGIAPNLYAGIGFDLS